MPATNKVYDLGSLPIDYIKVRQRKGSRTLKHTRQRSDQFGEQKSAVSIGIVMDADTTGVEPEYDLPNGIVKP